MSESGSMKRYAKFLRLPKDREVLIMAFPRGQKDKSWSWASQTINMQGNQNKKPDAAAPIKKAAAKQQRAHKPVKKLVAKSAKGKGKQVCT
jgi:rRNA pseudouridine-1189 N-methylase Emg1 (Nep1/Mra1 family)